MIGSDYEMNLLISEIEAQGYADSLKGDPDSFEANLNLGIYYLQKNEAEKAVPYLERVSASGPAVSIELKDALASLYAAMGDPQRAEKELKEAFKIDSKNYEICCHLGEICYRQGKIEEAIRYLTSAYEINGEDHRLTNDLGVLHQMKNDLRSAERYLKRSIALKPDYADPYFNIGILYMEDQRLNEAVDPVLKLIELEPGKPDHYRSLGLLYLKQEMAAEALKPLTTAFELDFESAESAFLLGVCNYALGDLQGAERSFNDALGLEPGSMGAKCALALLALRRGKAAEATGALERALIFMAADSSIAAAAKPKLSRKCSIVPFEMVKRNSGEGSNLEDESPEISVVIPVLDEEDNVVPLYGKLRQVLQKIGRPFEVLFVDDGSKDSTLQRLKELKRGDLELKIISLRKAYGQTAALSAGFDYARGDVIVTMDGDLQNDPEDIGLLLEKIELGYDVVSGWRRERKDNFFKRKLPSILANKLIGRLTGIRLKDYGCSLKAYKRGVIRNVRLYGEMHRFIPAVVSWLGAKIVEVPVRHHPRIHGKAKYGLSRTLRVVLDLINVKFLTSYLTRPMQYFGRLGIWSIGLAIAMGISLAAASYFYGLGSGLYALLIGALLFALVGVQLITIGLLAEIVIRTYHESQDKPVYVIKEIV